MKLRVTVGHFANDEDGPQALPMLHQGTEFQIEGTDIQRLQLVSGGEAFVAGTIVGIRDGDRIKPLGNSISAKDLDVLEGRFVAAVVESPHRCRLLSDRFGQAEFFYQADHNATVCATELNLLPVARRGDQIDQLALAHAVVAYGYRPPKRHTFYRSVRRLGVGDSILVDHGRIQIEHHPFEPIPSSSVGDAELNRYADLLLDAVRVRGSHEGNVVYLSSGWDSTALLACLVHIFGREEVRCVIGRMQYAHRSGVINQFELDRARAVADFFGVSLEIAELDYRNDGPMKVKSVVPAFRSHQLASLTGVNHAILAQTSARGARAGEVVFAGEISDGAHNLGFSQFVTIFHQDYSFREYADKMASYLFGPSFLRLFQDGTHETDAVYAWLRGRRPAVVLEPLAPNPFRAGQLLASFFLRPDRFPQSSLQSASYLTEYGRNAYQAEMQGAYLDRAVREVTPETLYSWYLYLYNSFHWQGSTVATLPLTANLAGLTAALPFWDSRLQEFLSAMPENCGRGLDLRPTKFPLKWTLMNRVKYPMHLQVGPHSYLYDVDPSFSHTAEILYGSSLADYFKNLLRPRTYRELFSSEVFDLAYIDQFVDRYLAGVEARGAEMNDLLTLCLLSMVGWYPWDSRAE